MKKVYFFINPDLYRIHVYTFHASKILIVIKYIYSKYNIKIHLITNLDGIDKNGIVIPNSIKEQQQLYYADFNILVNHSQLYDYLDDKEKCVELINYIDPDIPIINTFKNKTYSEHDLNVFLEKNKNFEFFIFKGKKSFSSDDIFVYKKNEVIDAYKTQKFNDYIIQPYLQNYKLNSINLLTYNGKILDFIITNQPNNYDKENMLGKNFFKINRNILHKNEKYYKEIYDISYNIIKKTNYSGFIEIEYLCNKDVLLLEINPRISGHILDINDNYNLIYVDILIIKYINFFNKNEQLNSIGSKTDLEKIKNTKHIYNHVQLIRFIVTLIIYVFIVILLLFIVYKIYSRVNK